jgi:hypothetical protein
VMMGSCALLSAGIVAVTLKEPQRGAKEEDLKEVLSKGRSSKDVCLSFSISRCLSLCLCVFCLCSLVMVMLMCTFIMLS